MRLAEHSIYTKALDVVVPFGPFLRRSEEKKFFTNWKKLIFQVLPFTFFVFWLFSFIPIIGTAIYLLVLVPLSAKRHIDLRFITSRSEKAHVYLWYLTAVVIGFGGIWGFTGHIFLADTVARNIGWDINSPFQTELAFYHLGMGVAALIAIWLRGHMITALVIIKAIFWYGAAFVHLQDAILNQNYSPLNIGPPLINDIVLPTVLLTLLYVALKEDFHTHGRKE